jgi:hypothetical protein
MSFRLRRLPLALIMMAGAAQAQDLVHGDKPEIMVTGERVTLQVDGRWSMDNAADHYPLRAIWAGSARFR